MLLHADFKLFQLCPLELSPVDPVVRLRLVRLRVLVLKAAVAAALAAVALAAALAAAALQFDLDTFALEFPKQHPKRSPSVNQSRRR